GATRAPACRDLLCRVPADWRYGIPGRGTWWEVEKAETARAPRALGAALGVDVPRSLRKWFGESGWRRGQRRGNPCGQLHRYRDRYSERRCAGWKRSAACADRTVI